MQPSDTKFDLLREWSSLPDDGIRSLFSETAVAELHYFLVRLGSAEEQQIEITRDSFARLLRKMWARYQAGSRLLAETIIAAGEASDNGDREAAIQKFVHFVNVCPSKCYVEVAEHYLSELRS